MSPRNIADEPDWEAITTLPLFRERVGGQFGVIVIQDDAGEQPIAHDRACSFLAIITVTQQPHHTLTRRQALLHPRRKVLLDLAEQTLDMTKSRPLTRNSRIADKNGELVGVVAGRLHLKPRTTPNLRTIRNQQLDEHRNGVRLRVRRDRPDNLARQTMIGSRTRRLRPTRWDRQYLSDRRHPQKPTARLGRYACQDIHGNRTTVIPCTLQPLKFLRPDRPQDPLVAYRTWPSRWISGWRSSSTLAGCPDRRIVGISIQQIWLCRTNAGVLSPTSWRACFAQKERCTKALLAGLVVLLFGLSPLKDRCSFDL